MRNAFKEYYTKFMLFLLQSRLSNDQVFHLLHWFEKEYLARVCL